MKLSQGELKDFAVRVAESAREKALATNDKEALGVLLTEQLVFVHSSGTVDSRHSLLEKMEQGRIQYRSVRLQPAKVQLLAHDTWALWGKMDAQILVSDMQRQIESSYVTVWVLEADGVLRLALHQGTPLATVK